MITVLLTGFGPYPGAPLNPTGELVQRLARWRPARAGIRLIPHVFVTSYAAVDRDWPSLLARYRPDAVLMFGLAPRSAGLRIETRARNALAAVADAEGRVPAFRAIAPGVDDRRAAVPLARVVAAARCGRRPARLSHHAGGYLCNYLYWQGLAPGGPRLVQFVHVPLRSPAILLPGAAAILATMLAALRRRRRP